MKHVKNKPPKFCEYRVAGLFLLSGSHACGKPAKYEHHFKDPKAKPMMVCGNHKRMMERRIK